MMQQIHLLNLQCNVPLPQRQPSLLFVCLLHFVVKRDGSEQRWLLTRVTWPLTSHQLARHIRRHSARPWRNDSSHVVSTHELMTSPACC